MNITCPSCNKVYTIPDDRRPASGMKMRCKSCSNVFAWDEGVDKAPRQGGGRRTIVVGNDDAAVRGAFKDVLKDTCVDVLEAPDGVEAFKLVEERKVDAAILDVALTKLYGFEICSMIKDNPELKSRTKVILMTSVYDKTKYKRNPASLYGADEYIERHHLHDMLIPKLEALFGQSITGQATIAQVPDKFEHDKYAEQLKVSTQPIASDDVLKLEKAKKLARIIVSDIALYNAETVVEGIKNGNFYELMKEDIVDGIKYFRKRVDKGIPADAFLKEAFDEFIVFKKKEMGIGS